MARIVLLHGMSWDGAQFDALRPLVPDLVTPTLRGLSLKEMVDEVAAVIEDGDVVGGMSMGAAVALAYAAQPEARCSALVQIGPAGTGDEVAAAARGYAAWLADTLEAGGYDALRAAGEPMVEFWERRMDPAHLLRLWRDLTVDMPAPDPANVRVPSLVIAWRGDGLHTWDGAESLAAALDAPLVEIPAPTSIHLAAEPLAAALRHVAEL